MTPLRIGVLFFVSARLTKHQHHYRSSIPHSSLRACGVYADLVLRFCASLKWPHPDLVHTNPLVTAGITWHELAVAFIVNTGLQFPTWIRPDVNSRARPFHWQDPQVLALPIPKRSLREQAEAFRTIVLYLQGYSHTPLLPTYSKTGSSSLTQTGWGRSYTGDLLSARRYPIPVLFNEHSSNMWKTCIVNRHIIHMVLFPCNTLRPISLRWTLSTLRWNNDSYTVENSARLGIKMVL